MQRWLRLALLESIGYSGSFTDGLVWRARHVPPTPAGRHCSGDGLLDSGDGFLDSGDGFLGVSRTRSLTLTSTVSPGLPPRS